MYIIYSGSNNQYASAAVSKRDGNNTSIEYLYLGRVIDKDKGIYKSKDRGMFTFDVTTGTFGDVPDSYIPSPVEDSRKKKRVSVDFGDAFFVDTFLHSSGLRPWYRVPLRSLSVNCFILINSALPYTSPLQ